MTNGAKLTMALVVFLPRPESIVYRIFMLVHFIPQNSLPCPVGTGDREASLAPLRSFEIYTHQNLISSLVCWKSLLEVGIRTANKS